MSSVRKLHVRIGTVVAAVIVIGGLTFRAGEKNRVLAQASQQAAKACEDIAQHEKVESHAGTKSTLEWLKQNGQENSDALCDLGEAVARLEERTKDE